MAIAFESLKLDPAELEALRRGGTVQSCLRGRSCIVFFLRFRMDGRQRRRYLGTDGARAQAVRDALEEWQRPRRNFLALKKAAREAGVHLRESRKRLAPVVQTLGYHFHGLRIRKLHGNPKSEE